MYFRPCGTQRNRDTRCLGHGPGSSWFGSQPSCSAPRNGLSLRHCNFSRIDLIASPAALGPSAPYRTTAKRHSSIPGRLGNGPLGTRYRDPVAFCRGCPPFCLTPARSEPSVSRQYLWHSGCFCDIRRTSEHEAIPDKQHSCRRTGGRTAGSSAQFSRIRIRPKVPEAREQAAARAVVAWPVLTRAALLAAAPVTAPTDPVTATMADLTSAGLDSLGSPVCWASGAARTRTFAIRTLGYNEMNAGIILPARFSLYACRWSASVAPPLFEKPSQALVG